jgi:hypothetical protein
VEADSLANAAAEASCAWATHAEDAARRAHWANAPTEGQEWHASEEYHNKRALQQVEAEMLELMPRERRRQANLRRREV